MLRRNINTYFAVLIITLVGAGASLLILHVAQTTRFGYYTENGIATTTQQRP
ncbi:MAG TPA: hypothetical protein PK539_03100 [Candidatus Paceibacterota bacterium]|nr:hypothetical protein [Candidatus Paceibacterota bacterium]